jgi:hypothetical protein
VQGESGTAAAVMHQRAQVSGQNAVGGQFLESLVERLLAGLLDPHGGDYDAGTGVTTSGHGLAESDQFHEIQINLGASRSERSADLFQGAAQGDELDVVGRHRAGSRDRLQRRRPFRSQPGHGGLGVDRV